MTANRWRMRCGVEKCRHRWTLRRHPAKYKRKPKCPRCGDVIRVRSVEEERRREMAKRKETGRFCECGGYPFPHEKGSLRFCEHHPLFHVEPDQIEVYDFEACWATPRGRAAA